MANPNAVNITSVYGNNSLTNLTTTSPTVIVNNPAGSGKLFKVNTVLIVNYVTTSISADLNIYTEDDLGGTAKNLVNDIVVPPNATIILIEASTAIYLKEDQSLGVTASVANDALVIASWEEISDA